MVPPKRLLFCLIDASSFIFRAYYAVRPLSNKEGLPTNAVFGFAQMMLKVLEEMQPSHIAVVYDTKYPSFRKELYPEYKANRSAMPEDLVPQMPYIKEFVKTLGLPAFEMKGYEADDIIATFAENAAHRSQEADVCIVSSDKDLMQLVNDHVYLYDTMKELRYNSKEVKEKLGVPPELVADLLGIVGDSSDNIPGVKGIGPKGAVALLEQFGSMENIYGNLAQVKKEGQRKQLEECREIALLSKQLATVKKDLPLPTDWHELRCQPVASEEFFQLLQKLEFAGLEKRMREWKMGAKAPVAHSAPASAATVSADPAPAGDLVAQAKKSYEALRTLPELKAAFAKLKGVARIALDTETTSLKVHQADLVGFSFCGDPALSYYVPIGHVDPAGALASGQIERQQALQELAHFLDGRRITGQNLKYDVNVLRRAGLVLKPEQLAFDSLVASYDLEPDSRHGLDMLAAKHLGHKNISYEEVCGSGKEQILFSAVAIEKATDYAAEDAHVAFLLADILERKLQELPELEKVFRTVDLPLVQVLADMEWEGVAIDSPRLAKLSTDFAEQLKTLEKRAHELAGSEFNLASPKQLQKILFEDLGLPTQKKTKTGFSTDVDVLEKLSSKHELPAVILEHRELSKLKGTYVDVLPTLVDPHTKRVHAQFNQAVAATGRLSSQDPNLQNIPIRSDNGRMVRQSFIARPGWFLLGADYSQIELRILASMSGDPSLTQAFREGQDVHALTASEVFGVALAEVDADQRRKAKAINFGLLYGKSAFALAEDLDISRGEASEIIKKYFARYPTIRGFLDGLVESAKKSGYAETLYGRRRYIEGIQSKNRMIQAGAERVAVNAPIQGTAADIVKIAMIGLAGGLRSQRFQAKLILQVHDELVVEAPEQEVEALRILVKEQMEKAGAGKITVPLTVEMGVAKNWLEL